YVLGSATYYGFPAHTPSSGVTAQTAVSALLLVPALLGGRPNQGIMTLVTSETRSGRMTRQILLAGIIAPTFIGTAIRLGVVAGWYDVNAQVPLFELVMAGLVFGATCHAARQSEREELRARATLRALERSNQQLNQTIIERQMFTALV